MYCSDYINETLPALGHNFGKWQVIKAATCTQEGIEKRVCTRDASHTETRTIAKKGHTPAAAVRKNETAATCTTEGTYDSVVYCSSCSKELSREKETSPALGHTWGAWFVTKAPTCTEAGIETRLCTKNSSHSEIRFVEPKAHTPAQAVRINEIAATCSEPGSFDNVVRCCSCKQELSRTTVTVPAISHEFSTDCASCLYGCGTKNPDYQQAQNADTRTTESTAAQAAQASADKTEQTSNNQAKQASGAQAEQERTPKEAKHTHSYTAKKVKPTAHALGYTLHTCSCGSRYQDSFTAPTGKVGNVRCKKRTASAQTFTWGAVKGANGYQLKLTAKTGTSESKTCFVQSGNTYTLSGLTAGTQYTVQVRFCLKAADGKYYYSAWSNATTSPTLPSGTTITKIAGGKKCFTVQWSAANASGYQLQYCTNAKYFGAKTLTFKNAATLKAAVKNLRANKLYSVRIRTYKTIAGSNYFSAWSKAVTVKTK